MSKTTIIALLAAVTLAFGITACKPKDTTTTETTSETTTQDNTATPANPDSTNTESTTTTE